MQPIQFIQNRRYAALLWRIHDDTSSHILHTLPFSWHILWFRAEASCNNYSGWQKSVNELYGSLISQWITDWRYVPRMKETWITRSKTYIFSNNFIDTFNSRTVEQNYQEFSNHIKKVIIEHAPSKMASARSNLPWFTINSLKRMCKKKQRLCNKAKTDKNNGNWIMYKSFKRETIKAIRKARWNYINNKLQIALEQRDPGPFWRYIRSQKHDNVGISPVKDGGKLHTDSMKKAEILSNQFKSVFT